jgi:hypothetical protein
MFIPQTASAAHLGNSKAGLVGTGDGDASGMSVVNYRKGTESFNASVSLTNLAPNATYTFLVRNAAGVERFICSAATNQQGRLSCNAQDVLPDGFGLARAVVRDAAGNEVAVGVYERTGNCRAPEQAGSQCEAPGHTH